MIIFQEIKDYIIPFIDWIVFLLVITSGYVIRATKLFPKVSTTLKVLITALVVTVSYSVSVDVKLGVFIASFFLAFGFHGAVLKLLELLFNKVKRYLKNDKNSLDVMLSNNIDTGGQLPPDDDDSQK